MHLWMFLFEISYYFQTFEYQYMSSFNVFEKNRFKNGTYNGWRKYLNIMLQENYTYFFFVKVKSFFKGVKSTQNFNRFPYFSYFEYNFSYNGII